MTSYSTTDTFTITHARHIASRIAADMRLFSLAYGYPSLDQIPNYLEEIAQYLAKGYLGSFEIGFETDGREVVVGLLYEVRSDGTLSDNRAGDVPLDVDITGAVAFNYLTRTYAWANIGYDAQARFEASLPIKRSTAPAPQHNRGYWTTSRSYASGGVGVQRRNFISTR
jgi:hypothetical protein